MEVLAYLRQAYQMCKKFTDCVTKDLVRGKLLERADPLSNHFVATLESMRFDSEEISETEFMLECARMEKHTLTSFTNLLYRQMTPELGDRDPEAEIAASIQSAIDNPDASVDDLKATLRQAQKLYQPNIDLYVPPVDHKSWMRFRNSVSAFYEVCTNPVVSMNSQAEMYIKN